MQTLSVLAVEDGAVVVVSPSGERFRLPVDSALRSRLLSTASAPDEKRLSPREIQAHIRSGLTAEQVAAMTGVPVAFIERFVGPVLAERAYIVESALAVRLPAETEGARSRTFGAVMGERLDALAAKDVRWTSAKEPSGWVLAVAFAADDVQHAARWRFDPKHMRLEPDNVEASTLSQQGVPAALTPRLRAIEPTAPVAIVPPPALREQAAEQRPPAPHGARVAPVEPDRTRFDSAAFRFPPLTEEPTPERPAQAPAAEPEPAASARPAARPVPTPPAERRPAAHAQPEQQRPSRPEQPVRRREPEPARADDAEALPPTRAIDVVPDPPVFAPRPGPGPVRSDREPAPVHRLPVRTATPHDAPAEDRPTEPLRRRRDRGGLAPVTPTAREVDEPSQPQPAESPVPIVRPRRGRTSMPSWDEIVFGRDEP
jgi:hypothetical protein